MSLTQDNSPTNSQLFRVNLIIIAVTLRQLSSWLNLEPSTELSYWLLYLKEKRFSSLIKMNNYVTHFFRYASLPFSATTTVRTSASESYLILYANWYHLTQTEKSHFKHHADTIVGSLSVLVLGISSRHLTRNSARHLGRLEAAG